MLVLLVNLHYCFEIQGNIYRNCRLVAKLCPTLSNSWNLAHQVPLSTGFPGKNTRVDCHVFLQNIEIQMINKESKGHRDKSGCSGGRGLIYEDLGMEVSAVSSKLALFFAYPMAASYTEHQSNTKCSETALIGVYKHFQGKCKSVTFYSSVFIHISLHTVYPSSRRNWLSITKTLSKRMLMLWCQH